MNIYEVSSRTRSKIIKRLNIPCSICSWNEAVCDIHHIVPKGKGGTNDHTNLTILCPNCHRLAHNKKITKFVSMEEQIGDKWKEYYAQKNIRSIEIARKGNLASLDKRRKIAEEKAKDRIEKIKSSGIDFSKRGWVEKVSDQFNIPHQHVSRFIRKHDEDFYSKCYRRSGN